MKRNLQYYFRLILRVTVHGMALILLVTGIKGLFLTTGYEVGLISPEDQNHLRVFWAIPIIVSLAIQYCLYSFYISKSSEKRKKYGVILKGIAIWMGIAAIVRVFSIVVLHDPIPRLIPIVVEFIFLPLLWYLSSDENEKTNANDV